MNPNRFDNPIALNSPNRFRAIAPNPNRPVNMVHSRRNYLNRADLIFSLFDSADNCQNADLGNQWIWRSLMMREHIPAKNRRRLLIKWIRCANL